VLTKKVASGFAIIADGTEESFMIGARILGNKGMDFLESRGINIELAVRFGIFTAKRAGHEMVPSESGTVIGFPFWDDEVCVNEKFRTLDKRFWQTPNGRCCFYNLDALRDPLFESGHSPVVITEGELDCLTAIQCGFSLSVSVPDGAPPANYDPSATTTSEAEGKFKYCWNAKELLAGQKKRFVIAVDNDAPGQKLASELVRRLLASRCSFVEYPPDCKDLNEVLLKHGPERVAAVISSAKPYPVRGLYRISDYPNPTKIETFPSGWFTLDPHFKMFAGEFCVITGVPSHGKSTFVLNLLVNMAKQYGWRSAIFSPEMPVVPFIRNRLLSIHAGSFEAASTFIEDRFVFIDSDPTGGDDENFTLDWVLDKATEAVMRDGIRILLIDPWNELEHARQRGESMPDYIGRAIRDLKRFARLREVSVIVVAHPTKDVWKDGKSRVPSLYDIEGAAHWFNKCDHGVVVERPANFDGQANIHIAKSRFREAGERGMVKMKFDPRTDRFELLDAVPSQAILDFE
jgi:twinkle protein